MIRKSSLLAVAASAALGLALLFSGSADARGFGGGHGGGHGFGGGHGMHGGFGGHRGFGGGHRGFGGRHFGGRHFGGHRFGHWRWHHRYAHWHRPYLYGYGYSEPVTYGVSRPVAAAPCTCLSKEYTDEGAVVFKDNCTNESAIAAPDQQSDNDQQDQAPVARR
jgi:hypothetical protein